MSNLEAFLRSFHADTDLREFQEPVRADLDALKDSMRRFFETSVPMLQGVAQHLLSVGGKKYRPTILLLISNMDEELQAKQHNDAVFAATVIELIHTATLIHDDTIDRSAMRRGLPTLNAMFNDKVATILGDYIYTKAFVELVDRDLPACVPVVARTTYRMTLGEVIGIEQKDDLNISEDDYFRLVDEKTASLMGASAEIGAIIGGFDAERIEQMQHFGEDLGRAYQVTDDLFDYLASQGQIGKGVGSDISAGKVTLPLIHAMRTAREPEREFLGSMVGRKTYEPEEWRRILDLLEETGAMEYSRDLALRLADQAVARLDVLPASPYRDALEKAVAYAVQRSH